MSSSTPPVEIRVLKVVEKKSEFYLGSVPAEQLVAMTYADVRRLAHEERDVERYLGIQRPVSGDRIKQIRKYLESPDAKFPTGIIIAVDERCAVLTEDGALRLSPYEPEDPAEEPIPFEKIGKILDGQHRLAAFLDKEKKWDPSVLRGEPFELGVVFFVGADLATQAEIFATVNLAQTKVNRSLVYDLQDLAESRSPFKTCHEVAVALDEIEGSPLYERIKRLGVRTEGRDKETITQAAFVESLVKLISVDPLRDRNAILDGKVIPAPTPEELTKTPFRLLFVDGKDLDIVEIVSNYFKAIEKKWPDSWRHPERKGNIVAKSNAFKAFMRYLRDIYPEASGETFCTVPTVDQFLGYFSHIHLTDEQFTKRNFVPGSGGESMFYRVLAGKLDESELFEKPTTGE